MSSTGHSIKAAESLVRQLQCLAANEDYKQIHHIVEENTTLKEENSAFKVMRGADMKALAELQKQVGSLEVLSKENADLKSALLKANKAAEERRKALEQSSAGIKDLQASLNKTDRESSELKDRLKQEQKNSESIRRGSEGLQKELEATQATLKTGTKKLNRLESFAFQMESSPKDATCQHLQAIFKAALTLATTYFGADLEQSVLDDSASWEALRNHNLIKRAIPLPLSNTPATKQMRVAAVLTIIADWLSQLIFRPTYSLIHSHELQDLMAGLSTEDPGREAYFRAVLLSLSPNTQEQNRRTLCGQVVAKVSSYTDFALPASKKQEFRASLERLCEQACSEWLHLQILTDRVEPSFDTDDVQEWRVLPSVPPDNSTKNSKVNARGRPNGATSSQSAGDKDQVDGKLKDLKDLQAPVWPSFVLYGAGGIKLLEKGFALTEAQTKSARDEEIAEQGRRRAARGTARRPRNYSMSFNADEPAQREGSFLSGSGGGSQGS